MISTGPILMYVVLCNGHIDTFSADEKISPVHLVAGCCQAAYSHQS